MSETIIGMPSLISNYILFRILELCPLICQKILLCFSWSGHIHVLFFGGFFLYYFFIYFFVHFLHLQKIALLEEELQKQEYDEDSGTDSPPPGKEHDLPRDGTRQSRGHRRRRLLPSNVSVRQEEV